MLDPTLNSPLSDITVTADGFVPNPLLSTIANPNRKGYMYTQNIHEVYRRCELSANVKKSDNAEYVITCICYFLLCICKIFVR